MNKSPENIYLIISNGCQDCRRMKIIVDDKTKGHPDILNIVEYNIDDSAEEAVDVALELGMDDVPSIWIDGKVIQGKDFSSKSLMDAFDVLINRILNE